MLAKQKHFLAFISVGLAINCLSYLTIAEHFKQGSDLAFVVTLFFALYPITLCALMIATCKTEKQLFLIQKLIPSIIYITLQILTTIGLNILNPFDRVIDQATLETGIENNFILGSVQIVLLIPILFFVKARIKKQTQQ